MRTEAPSAWLVCLGLFAAACESTASEEAEPLSTAEQAAPLSKPEGLETLGACSSSPASFQVSPGDEVGGPIVGFGAQFNSHLFQRSGRFNQNKIDELANLLNKLHPQHVRIFFDSRAFRSPSYKTSFSRTVGLARNAGATINVTYWHGPYKGKPGTSDFGRTEMNKFADVLKGEFDAGHDAIKVITIQNEPNRTRFNAHKNDYIQLYRTLHLALESRGIRGRVKLVPELTRGVPGTKSWFEDWLAVIGPGIGHIIDGYAFHIYWDHDMADVERIRRLGEIKSAIQALPSDQRKPIYATEFGTRGEPDTNKSALPFPGWSHAGCTAGRAGCRRMLETTEAGANNAFFQVAAARAGFRAFVYWDAYWAMYDKTEQFWSLIGKPSEGLEPNPTYFVQKLLAHAVGRGWTAVSVSDPGREHLKSTAFKGKDDLTILGVNKSGCGTTFRYSGLPGGKKFYVVVWNHDGSGTLCSRGLATATGGKLTVAVNERSLVALSTRPTGMTIPTCGRTRDSAPPDTCGDGECNEEETDATCATDCGCTADSCGTVAPFGCYCDADCEASGDCCADVGVCR